MKFKRSDIVAIIAVLLLIHSNTSWFDSFGAKVDQVTYVHERDKTPVPPGVFVAMPKLNEQGIKASVIDIQTLDPDSDLPEQYKNTVPAAEGKEPCLVIQSAGKVLKVIPDPQADMTEEEVMEASK